MIGVLPCQFSIISEAAKLCHVLEVEVKVQHGIHGEFMAVSNRHSVLLLLPQRP